jgi:3-polyprenyl-4-hydroxybenzoate decarboxylase
MGAILDPSNRQGTTAKMIVDATRKTNPFPRRHTIPSDATSRARDLIEKLKAGR